MPHGESSMKTLPDCMMTSRVSPPPRAQTMPSATPPTMSSLRSHAVSVPPTVPTSTPSISSAKGSSSNVVCVSASIRPPPSGLRCAWVGRASHRCASSSHIRECVPRRYYLSGCPSELPYGQRRDSLRSAGKCVLMPGDLAVLPYRQDSTKFSFGRGLGYAILTTALSWRVVRVVEGARLEIV